MLDFRTTCPLGNMTHAPNYERFMQFIKTKAAYFYKSKETTIYGYRYVKDPLNYWFKFYNFTTYHNTLAA